MIDGFKATYGLKVNELNPDAGSGDEVEAIKANKGNKGPQAPDVIDVGLSFGPTAKSEGLLAPYKVATWKTIPDSAKDAEGYWYGDYYGVLAIEVNTDIIKKAPTDWADLLGAGLQERRRARRRSARLEPGDPGRLRRRALGLQWRYRQGRRRRAEIFRRSQQERQFRAHHRQGRDARPRVPPPSSCAGTITLWPTATR